MFEYTYQDTSNDDDADTRNTRLDNELFRSFHNLEVTTPQNHTPRNRMRGASSDSRESGGEAAVAPSFRTEVLTPLRKRVEKQFIFSGLDSRSSTALG
jgi:hypothetical protein